MGEQAISLREVARRLGWSDRTVRRRVKERRLRAHRSKRRLCFLWSEVVDDTRESGEWTL